MVALLLFSGVSYQFITTKYDESKYPPLGQMVDVGGYRLHLYSMGVGGPAVVLEAGMGCISSDWGLVQPEIAKFTQVVSYDRAGTGWSEPSPFPRTSQQIVHELHALLEKAQIPKPYILVGHSFGGNNVQLYAATYPDDVLGIVLVDSCHEDQERRLPRHPLIEWQMKLMQSPKTVYLMSTLGISRFMALKYIHVMKPFLPEMMHQRHLALCSTTKHDCAVAAEGSFLSTSLKQVKDADRSLIKNKPCFVISAGAVPDISKLGFSQEFVQEMHTVWNDLQKDLALKFEGSHHLIAEKSDHMVQWHQPELVIYAVKNLLKPVEDQMIDLTTALSAMSIRGDFAPEQPSKPVIFSQAEGISWVKQCIQQHPEILWLADASVRKTEEGSASLQGPYSEQLFGQKFIEFDRTLMTIHCLKLILDGSEQAYQTFTSAQPKEVRLSQKSFQELHLEGTRLLKSEWGGLSELQMAQAMETALVLGDIGKSEKARELFGIKAPDHDDFYGEAMQVLAKEPQLCPSFAKLPEEAKKLLIKVANLAHYGHITHLEGGPSMFDKLKASDSRAVSFDLFVHTCDVAGALGHVNNTSSLVYTELAHQSMQAMGESVRLLSDSHKTTKDAYNAYLAVRASWLGLNPDNGIDRVLVRVGAMLRLFTPEEGAILKRAVDSMAPAEREKIIAGLDVQKERGLLQTPTYMPAVLVNLSNNPQLGKTKEERLSQAILLGLPFICRVLEMHQANQQADPNIPRLNFNKMAGVAKTAPHQLTQPCKIDVEGLVTQFQ